MKTGYIKITDSSTVAVKIVNGTVWMTVNEIADLFGVYLPTINKQLKGIFKDNLLRESEVSKEHNYTRPEEGEYIRVYYNLEAIIFLSFRIQSLYTKAFREWILHAFCEYNKHKTVQDIIVTYNVNTSESSLLNLN